MLPLLALLFLPQDPPAQVANLGTFNVGGKEVPIVVPAAEGPIGPSAKVITLDGEKYFVDGSGRIVRHFRASGGWSEVRDGYTAAKAAITPQTPEWRVKVFLLPRSDILDLAPSGLARIRRSTLEAPEVAHVSESLARFGAMAEAAALGKLKVKIDYEIDSDTVYQTSTSGHKPFDSRFLVEYLTPRINGGLYEAEDRVYRGPYDSVFLIHGGFSGAGPGMIVSDTAVSPISFNAQGLPHGQHALSLSLFNNWAQHLSIASSRRGYRIDDFVSPLYPTLPEETGQGYGPEIADPSAILKGTMWGSVLGREDPATELFVRNFGTSAPVSTTWSEVSDDPFAKLPKLDLYSISQRIGLNGVAVSIATRNSHSEINADSVFVSGEEAIAVFQNEARKRQLTFVDSAYIDVFAKGLPASADPKLIGWGSLADRTMFVFESALIKNGAPEAAMLELPGFKLDSITATQLVGISQDETAAQLIPDGSTASSLPVLGGTSVTDATDGDRGDVLSLRTIGFVRTGSALLLGRRNGPAVFDANAHPYLSLYVKAQNPEPMDVIFVPADGTAEKRIRLFGRWPVPAELGGADPALEAIVASPQAWSHAVIDLRKAGIGKTAAIYLSQSEYAGYWPAKQAVAPVVLFDDLRVSKTAPGPELELRAARDANVAADSPVAEGRAIFAAKASADSDGATVTNLIALLKDPDEMVRLNAARAFSRIKSPAAEAPLGELVRDLEPRIAEAALDAMAFQDTPTAWAVVKRAIEVGPFDFTRVFGIRAYGRKMDPKSLATLSLALTSSSWRGRQYAAEAIGNLPSQPLPLVLMAFLVETNPAVRLAATKGAAATDEEVCKRLLWSAVNDPSDEIRAWSCMKLIESGNAKYVTEGLKGVRDDSVGMRKRLLLLMREKPSEAIRPALRLAVADTSPSVRAEALLTFAKIPGQVTADEVQNTLNDPDPRVKAALAELRRAKGF